MKGHLFHKVSCYLVLLCATIQGYAVENSVIPLMERFEQVENLSQHKYSRHQFGEISCALAQKSNRIRLVTYNMLFNRLDSQLNPIDRWPQRLPRIVELLNEMQPDVIGVQELYPDQLEEMIKKIGQEFAYYGLPCEKENNGIFYRRDRFELVKSQVMYMTSTPQVPSPDTLTMVQLQDRATGEKFAVFNTHLAFFDVDKREYQARYIAEHTAPVAKEMPVIVTGDLNTFTNRPDLVKLPFFDGDYIYRILTKGPLKNSRDLSLVGHVGPISSFTNDPNDKEPFMGLGTPGVILDAILVSTDITVLLHAIQPGTVEGHFPSDHMPVLIDFLVDSGR